MSRGVLNTDGVCTDLISSKSLVVMYGIICIKTETPPLAYIAMETRRLAFAFVLDSFRVLIGTRVSIVCLHLCKCRIFVDFWSLV